MDICAIQVSSRVTTVQFVIFVEIQKEHTTCLCFQYFLFRKRCLGICRVPMWIVNTQILYHAIFVKFYTKWRDIVRGLVCSDSNILVMELTRHAWSNIWIL